MKIRRRGKVKVNNNYYEYRECRVISIDCSTKRPEVVSTGSTTNEHESNASIPILILAYANDSVSPDQQYKGWTEVEFPEFTGWDLVSADVSRYTVNCTFVKYE